MAAATKTTAITPKTEAEWASDYAGSLIYDALLAAGEPVKASEVVKYVQHPDVDLKLARVVLTTNPGMTVVEGNKWTLWTRFNDNRATVDKTIKSLLDVAGKPLAVSELAQELSHIYGRPAPVYEGMLERLTESGENYFAVSGGRIAPADWLLTLDQTDEDEILFDNFLDDADVFPYEAAAVKSGLIADNPASIGAFLKEVGVPVKQKAIQFLAWRALENKDEYDATAFYEQIVSAENAAFLPGGYVFGADYAKKLTAHFRVLAEQEVSDNAEAEAMEAAKPLVIGDAEREELIGAILEGEVSRHADELLESIFDVLPSYRTYGEDLQTVTDVLRNDPRVVWVGADRFRPEGTIPPYVFTVPSLLEIPKLSFMDEEGNTLDQLLEDEGLDGGLAQQILDPLAQDVYDEEPGRLPDLTPPSNARAVIKYHHKMIGTLPLCQFPPGFFPQSPAILEAELTLPNAQKITIWINNETRLIYGLYDWFETIPIDSGATFTLERQAADKYIITYSDETEPAMFISRNRLNELQAMQERAETENISTFDLMCEIMEHARKGMEFLTLHTELNVARRVTRRLVASNLSAYHCFTQRGGAWVYDPKKLSQGFDKSKRKHLMK
jgi:hypothetical protein